MGKITRIFILLCTLVSAENSMDPDKKQLQKDCLECHQKQQIPNEMVYRRYLSIYSTPVRIKEAMVAYLRNPQKEYSIMPPQFFLKFPMKENLNFEDERLIKDVELYLDAFDIKKKLTL
jgi:hypothetical protein